MILRWKSKLERHALTYYTKMFYNIGPWEVSDKRSLKAKSFPKVLFTQETWNKEDWRVYICEDESCTFDCELPFYSQQRCVRMWQGFGLNWWMEQWSSVKIEREI